MARCPGQDQRFWKPEDIFEVECPTCRESVEFWKDEPQVKCPHCKQTIPNPKLDLGCAKWCQYAEECLGQLTGQDGQSLGNKLIESLREIAESDQEIIRLSLEILSYAEKIQAEEGGDPLVIKASAILSQIYKQKIRTEPKTSGENKCDDRSLLVRDILGKHGIESDSIDHICRILAANQHGPSIDTIEFKIVSDACRLANLRQQVDSGCDASGERPWKTRTSQRLAEIVNR